MFHLQYRAKSESIFLNSIDLRVYVSVQEN